MLVVYYNISLQKVQYINQKILQRGMRMELDYNAIGKRIKIARIQSDMTQEKLAEAVDMSPTHLSNIERGNGKVSLAALVNIANVLSVTMDVLLCDNIVKCKPEFEKDIQKLLDDCDEYEIRKRRDRGLPDIRWRLYGQ